MIFVNVATLTFNTIRVFLALEKDVGLAPVLNTSLR